MIITVTMNPAIDKTVELKNLERGSLNRLKNVITDVGGKGINVSKTIKALGGETIATGFIGGSGGRFIKKVLKEQGIKTDFVEIKNEVRTNLKVLEEGDVVTELNEPGPVVSKEEFIELEQKLLGYAKKGVIFILAGSVPEGIDKTVYGELITKLKKKGAEIFLDADGELFSYSLEAGPDYIKPNRAELQEYYHLNYRPDDKELIENGKELLKKGIRMVVISLGEKGALFLTKDKIIKCPGLKVEVHSTVGAGDAMVAALAYALNMGFVLEECVKLAMAASAGAVTTQGTKPPARDVVDQLIKKVEIISLDM
jgi:1-phosphofructokinase